MELDEIRDKIIEAITHGDEAKRQLVESSYTDADLWKAVGEFGAINLVLNELPEGNCFQRSEIASHCEAEYEENASLVFEGFMGKIGEFVSLGSVLALTIGESPNDILFVHPDYKKQYSEL